MDIACVVSIERFLVPIWIWQTSYVSANKKEELCKISKLKHMFNTEKYNQITKIVNILKEDEFYRSFSDFISKSSSDRRMKYNILHAYTSCLHCHTKTANKYNIPIIYKWCYAFLHDAFILANCLRTVWFWRAWKLLKLDKVLKCCLNLKRPLLCVAI